MQIGQSIAIRLNFHFFPLDYPTMQGPARRPKPAEQGVTIHKLNDFNAEKIPAQR